MDLSRRSLLKTSTLAGAAGAAGLAGCMPAGQAVRPRSAVSVPHGTTLDRTLVHGTPGAGGYRLIVIGPGEAHQVRNDIGGAAHPRRVRRRRPLVAFAQFSDIHVLDAQSPARAEYLDRFADPGQPAPQLGGAYRPQEILTLQVADAMARAVNRIRRGPATGVPLAFTICTGDNADNTQYNEVRWMIDVLDGGRITPGSGSRSRYQGVMDWVDYDVHYWHPEGTPPGKADDRPRSRYGFPVVPGLLEAAIRPFTAAGLDMPWLTVFGNHDGLVQGDFPDNSAARRIATGSRKVTGLAAGISLEQLGADLLADSPATFSLLDEGPTRRVTADPDRRMLSRPEIVREHFTTAGRPRGHGYTSRNLADDTAYYAFGNGQIRFIVLDTVNQGGGSDGSLDDRQFGWLERQLVAGSSRYLDRSGNVVSHPAADWLFILFSHHTIGTMDNPSLAPGEAGPRIKGPQMQALLLRFPNVVAWVNGHTHQNQVTGHARPKGAPFAGGFWEVNTASHIDWPQQCRLVEVTDNRDGTLSVITTIVDADAPPSYLGRLDDPAGLASLSRELGANDWQAPPSFFGFDGKRGSVFDRNVELIVPAPAWVAVA
jgi:metallophosphoesterase (TIGR03767 family)